jgi:hypothetical protein
LSSRPPTPPGVPFGTRRFNGLRVAPPTPWLYSDIQGVPGIPTVPVCTFRHPNARRSLQSPRVPPYSTQGSRFSPFSAFPTLVCFPSALETSTVRPFPLRSFSLDTGHPPSRYYGRRKLRFRADFLQFSYTLPHRFLHGRTLRQSPLKVFARPLQVRAGNFRPIQPPYLHPKVRAALDFALLGKLIRLGPPYIRFLFVGPGFCLQLPSDSTSRWTPLLLAHASCYRAHSSYPFSSHTV